MKLPFDCTDLIQELKTDISEFGPNIIVDVKFSYLSMENEFLATDYQLHFDIDDPDWDDEDRSEILKSEMLLNVGEQIRAMSAVEALLIFAKQDSILGGLQYIRELIAEYSPYIKIGPLLENYKIDRSNFRRFMNGDDTQLNEDKAIILFKALLNRPLK